MRPAGPGFPGADTADERADEQGSAKEPTVETCGYAGKLRNANEEKSGMEQSSSQPLQQRTTRTRIKTAAYSRYPTDEFFAGSNPSPPPVVVAKRTTPTTQPLTTEPAVLPVPQKKKRGRPRKYPLKVDPKALAQNSKVPVAPAPAPAPAPASSSSSSSSSSEESEDESDDTDDESEGNDGESGESELSEPDAHPVARRGRKKRAAPKPPAAVAKAKKKTQEPPSPVRKQWTMADLSSSSESEPGSEEDDGGGHKRKRGFTNAAQNGSDSDYADFVDSDDDGPPDGPPEILFYGDSLTYGMAHDRAGRYDVPWPRLCAEALSKEEPALQIVESAMCSRTTQFDDLQYSNKDWLPKMRPHFFNGARHLIPTLLCHTPHWLVILLGTNDLQKQIQKYYKLRRLNRGGAKELSPEKCAEEIAESVVAMAFEAKRHFPKTRCVVLTPPPFRLTEDNREWGFNEKSVEIASFFPYAFGKVCRNHGISNACYPEGSIDMSESVDGVHITEAQNQIYADTLSEFISSYKCQRPQRKRKLVEMYIPESVVGMGAQGSDYLEGPKYKPAYTFK